MENVADDWREFLETPVIDKIDQDFSEKLLKDTDKQGSNPLFKRSEETLFSMNEKMISRFRRSTRKSSLIEDERNFEDFFQRAFSRETADFSFSREKKEMNHSNPHRENLKVKEEEDEEDDIMENEIKVDKEKEEAGEFITNSSTITFNKKNKTKSSLSTDNTPCYTLKTVCKKDVPHLDSFQMKFLFKDFIQEDVTDSSSTSSDFKDKLKDGIYSENFYQNVYNKYNGLSESLANKRKHVCLKLLNILRLIVGDFI